MRNFKRTSKELQEITLDCHEVNSFFSVEFSAVKMYYCSTLSGVLPFQLFLALQDIIYILWKNLVSQGIYYVIGEGDPYLP